MPRLVLLLSLLAAPAAAYAQDSTVVWQRLWPDAVGDVWEYRSECSASFPGCGGQPVYRYRYEVVGDTLVEGTRFALFSGRRGDGPEGRCAVGVRPGDRWFSRHDVAGFPSTYCSPVGDPYPGWESSFVIAQDQPYAPVTVMVGASSYTVDAALTTGIPVDSYAFAADVGLYRSAWRGGGGGQFEQAWITELEYAEVGGVVYGTPVLGVEEPAGEAGTLAVWPNPARGRVELAFTLARPGAVSLEVVDPLGRVVLVRALGVFPAGEARRALDLSALAPGVYVLRLLQGDGVVTVRRITRVA